MSKIQIRTNSKSDRRVEAGRKPKVKRAPGRLRKDLEAKLPSFAERFFEEAGEELYCQLLCELNDTVERVLPQQVSDMISKLKVEHGNSGYKSVRRHIRQWLEDLILDLRDEGMDEVIEKMNKLSVDVANREPLAPMEAEDKLLEVKRPTPVAEDLGDVVPDAPEGEVEEILKGEEEEEQRAAARTIGDVKREFQVKRNRRYVLASESKARILESAAESLRVLYDENDPDFVKALEELSKI
jgi:hypothetical protein